MMFPCTNPKCTKTIKSKDKVSLLFCSDECLKVYNRREIRFNDE